MNKIFNFVKLKIWIDKLKKVIWADQQNQNVEVDVELQYSSTAELPL